MRLCDAIGFIMDFVKFVKIDAWGCRLFGEKVKPAFHGVIFHPC